MYLFRISNFISALPLVECDTKTQFHCGGGICIPLSQVCNGQQDCPEGEDEPRDNCGINECAVNNGGCSHKCIDKPIGYNCDCNPGFKLVDNSTCKGIIEYCTSSDIFTIRLPFCRCK